MRSSLITTKRNAAPVRSLLFRSIESSVLNKTSSFMPAVEVHATMLLNLVRQDWLRRTPPAIEWGISLIVALVFGAGLTRFRPPMALLLALAGIAATTLVALLLFGSQRL